VFNIGPGELIAISMVALLVLGPQRLPEAVRTVGRVIGELRRISGGFQDELRNALDDSELDDLRRSDHRNPPSLPPLPDEEPLPSATVERPESADTPDAEAAEADPVAKSTRVTADNGAVPAIPADAEAQAETTGAGDDRDQGAPPPADRDTPPASGATSSAS
jgi:sec-independent protein translocase protein TatB